MATHEELVDRIMTGLADTGALPRHEPVHWGEFGQFSRLVHERFDVPSSTLTPIMRRMFYAVGNATAATEILAVGSFVGYAVAFLAGGTDPVRVTGIDPDPEANRSARENLASVLDNTAINIIEGTAPTDLHAVDGTPDLVLLDLDDPETGKTGYTDTLEALLPNLEPGAVIVAHDVCVLRFTVDIDRYHEFVRDHPQLNGPWTLALDDCGLSLTTVSHNR